MKKDNLKLFLRPVLTMVISFFLINVSSFAQSDKNNDRNFTRVARDLTSRLTKRVSLDKDQTKKVEDILVGYQQDIADKWENKGSTAGNDMLEDLRDADKRTNDKIEKILSGNEISGYMDYKKEWWSKIKSHVYSKDFMDMAYYREEDENQKSMADQNETGSRTAKNERTTKTERTTKSLDSKDLESRVTPFAKDQAELLMNKLNLSLQQAADVQEALVDYQKSIAETRDKQMNKNDDYSSPVAVNDSRTAKNQRNASDNETGSSRQKTAYFQDVDNSAMDKVEDVFKDNQKPKYDKVKSQWWKEVKDKVYANVQRENRNMTGEKSK